MRGLTRRTVVVAGAAVVLLGPAVGVASAAGAAVAGTRLAAGRDGSGGTWGTAKEVPGTATLNQGGSAAAGSVSCASAGTCSAGGYHFDGSGHQLAAMLPALTFAVPAQGGARSLPPAAGASPAAAFAPPDPALAAAPAGPGPPMPIPRPWPGWG